MIRMSVQTHLRNTFLAGAFAAAPVAVTVFLIYWVESTVRRVSGIPIPFVGV
jgi:uncharacterized membrane protein